ncbi:MAG: bifunctional (p)ppGpp synthetase/guanosine-3',5'-bis(diphosphate) 3'-pyrophosphohydrolase [Bacteroidetes bacterium]|nr:MAG: bifunctional (p)ppGpp synthetase/guanosine-3',5'-bis(diphosphate) 3'-pyrophosphohydrolase [Bacteroidota bacterium]
MSVSLPHPEEEKRLIQRAYRRLLRSFSQPLKPEDKKLIRKAYEVAVQAHAKQRRKSGEPYILHPIEVARICAEEIGLGPTAIVAALLHDVVEDTHITLEEIEAQFGKVIAKMVDGLTKLDATYDSESPQAENFKKVLSTLVEDTRVVLIKMADRLHNMRTLDSMPHHKQLKIAAETDYIYAPLAHRLGLYNLKTEFEDLCLKVTDPDTYHEIAQKLNATKRERTRYINEFIKPLTARLDELGYPYRITGRPKSIYSIVNKIRTKKVPFEEIYDLFAIRIIVDVPPEKEKAVCWQVYTIVTDVYRTIPQRLKDYITVPKSNGYMSLHATAIGPKGRYVEVQIRSERMDEIAERGYAAHWKYKGLSDQPSVYETWLDGVREILESSDSSALEFINDFKTNLFAEEVYVTTPKGDIVTLPKGATALDFAFHIHTEIGYHAKAIHVNNRVVPMGYKLQNGDQVSVTTDKKQKPSEDWLKWVVTGKARSRIRSAMKEERRKVGEIGREALERKFRHLKVADYQKSVEELCRFLRMKSHVDLYYAIATEDLNLNEVLKEFEVKDHRLVLKPRPATEAEPREESRTQRFFTKRPPKLLIGGEPANQYQYSLATCCNPVQGDDVFAYVTKKGGIKIHRSNCPNAKHLLANFSYRVMPAEWITSTDTTFVAHLLIEGIDDGPGVIEKLSHEISSRLGVNIRSFNISGNEGYFEGRMSLMVANKDQLNLAIRTLLKLENVTNVTRIE